MKRILVTNDDGIDSRGIKALAKAMKELRGVHVTVCAPTQERSATSHSLTLHRPLRIYKKQKDVYAIDGTPTDCVMLGSTRVCEQQPDLIVSGVNRGGNLGDDVHYSGTVSAAIEGGIMGIPAIAFSQLGVSNFDYKTAVAFAKKLVRKVLKNGLPDSTVLNVNIPEGCKSLAYEVVKTGKRNYGDLHEERMDPRGKPYYWIGGNIYEFQDIPGSDCNTIVDGKISITPLHVNLTNYNFIKTMKGWKI